MKNKYAFKKVYDHMQDAEKKEVDAILKEEGVDLDSITVERKAFGEEIKEEDMDFEKRTAVVRVSTRDVDSVGDVVVPSGVILTEFKKEGMPFFWQHDIREMPMGSDEWIKTDAYGVKAKSVFADTGEGTPQDILWKLVKQGHQRQSSIGFALIQAVYKGTKEFRAVDKQLAAVWPEYKKNRKFVNRIITKALLLEHSLVGIGCNSATTVESVSKQWKDAGADDEILKKAGLFIEDANEVKDDIEDKVEEVGEIEDGGDIDKDANVVEPKDSVDEEPVEKEVIEDEVKGVKEIIEPIPIKKFAKVIKKPTYVKVIKEPDIDFKEIVDREIRKALGKVV